MQAAPREGAKTLLGTHTDRPARYVLPSHYDQDDQRKFPVLMVLHGWGSSGKRRGGWWWCAWVLGWPSAWVSTLDSTQLHSKLNPNHPFPPFCIHAGLYHDFYLGISGT